MSTDTTVRWFDACAAAAAASETAGPFPNLRPLSAADKAEAQAAGRFARSVQLAGQRIDTEIGFDNDTQGGGNG